MKKIIIMFAILIGFNPVFASDFTQYCSSNTASSTFLGSLESITGINFIARNIFEGQIASAAKKETGSKFNVDIDSFFGVNVLNGEFRNLKASSNNFNYDGISASKVDIETVCPYNKIGIDNGKVVFKENMVLKYVTEITQEDLTKIASSSKYAKIINKINSDKTLSSLVKITSSDIKLNNDKLVLNYAVTPLLNQGILSHLPIATKTLNLSFSTGLKAENGELKLCNFGLNSKKIGIDALLPLINKFNPLSYGIKLGQTNKGTVEVQNVTIANSKIKVDGMVLLPKDAN